FRENHSKPNEAALRVAYRVARAGEAHTIAETLVKPCIIEVAQCLFTQKEVDVVKKIPLSNNTAARRISDISDAIEVKVVEQLKSSPMWVMQLDESTDVAGLAILLLFVRYLHEKRVHEELLICKPLQQIQPVKHSLLLLTIISASMISSGKNASTCAQT